MPSKRTPTTRIGPVLLQLLEKRGMTRRALGALIDGDAPLVTRLIHGQQNLTAPMAVKVAKALYADPYRLASLAAQDAVDRVLNKEAGDAV